MDVPARVVVEDATQGGKGLGPGTRRVAVAIAEALFSTAARPAPEDRLGWLADDLDAFFAHAGSRSRGVFVACAGVIEWCAAPLAGVWGRFSSLPLARRAEVLHRLEASPAALTFFAAKTVLCIVWYEHPASWADTGFDNQCLRRSR